MPLKVMEVVEQRFLIVQEALRPGANVSAVSRQHRISRSTLYEWLASYQRAGLEGLVPRPSVPLKSPGQISAELEDAILLLRKQHQWGPRKIRDELRQQGWDPLPAISTVQQALARRGIGPLRPRQVRRRDPGQQFCREHSNELWQIDGSMYRLANGREYWVVDIVDDCSRFCLAAVVGPALTGLLAWTAFRTAVAAYGLPAQLLSDNGLCFTGRTHFETEVAFERQVHAAGTAMTHSRPYHPQCCGKIERLHRTDRDWQTLHKPVPRSLEQAQRHHDAFVEHYNQHRPHQSLDGDYPIQRYQPGEPLRLPTVELEPAGTYPPGCLRRRVKAGGGFSYGSTYRQLDARWAGITIGLIRTGGRLEVYYGSALIDTLIVGTHAHPKR
jgi:transposase InsO family protein